MRTSSWPWLLVVGACSSGGSPGTAPGSNGGGGDDGGGDAGGGGGAGGDAIATGRKLPGAIAVDDASVYWIEGDGAAKRAPKSGGAPVDVGGGCKAGAIAIDESRLYCGGTGGTVTAFPLGGGAATVVAGAQPVSDLATGGQHVYWTTYYGLRPAGDNDVGAVAGIAAGADGGGVLSIATKQRVPSSLAVDSSYVYWLTLVDPAKDTGTSVMRAPLAGGAASVVATGSGASPSIGGSRNKAIAVDATSVYWSELAGAIRKAPLAGGAVTTIADGQDTPGAIAVDGSTIYWATVTAIMEAPLAGGAPRTFVAGENAGAIAVDDSHVYWTNTAKGTVARAPK